MGESQVKRLLDPDGPALFSWVGDPRPLRAMLASLSTTTILDLDLSGCASKAQLLGQVRDCVECPHPLTNWDAIVDCFRDLQWLSVENGVILVVHGIGSLPTRDAEMLLSVLEQNHSEWTDGMSYAKEAERTAFSSVLVDAPEQLRASTAMVAL